jgi:hypothetical protein
MNVTGNASAGGDALELPGLSLDVEALDLGPDTTAVGLELLETQSREPAKGQKAAAIWAAVFPALALRECLVIDFFSHIDRVREFCIRNNIHFREAAERCLVLSQPDESQLELLFARFEGETFGVRVGTTAEAPDAALEKELSHRGLDAYETYYQRYTFCAVCEPQDGWVTLLSKSLWPTEIIRRVRPASQRFDVYISRPQ